MLIILMYLQLCCTTCNTYIEPHSGSIKHEICDLTYFIKTKICGKLLL